MTASASVALRIHCGWGAALFQREAGLLPVACDRGWRGGGGLPVLLPALLMEMGK